MNISDSFGGVKMPVCQWARGLVKGCYINPVTRERRGEFEIRNIITYTAADIMARLLGDDRNYVPRYMGFIYGASATPGAALIDPPTSRVQTWSGLASELADPAVTGNILISPLAAGPSYAVDGNTNYYTGNAVTLTANSGRRTEYGFPNSAPYAPVLADGNYFYQAMLLTRLVSGSTITYLPFARVTLKHSGSYTAKPVGFELALFWQLSYY